MDKLRDIIGTYTKWQGLEIYINRIEGFRDDDFSVCVESAKSLLETVAKEICKCKDTEYSKQDGIGKILKLAFASLGYDTSNTAQQIAGAIANVGHQMGLLRNEIGAISHGKPLDELEKRKKTLDKASSEFLLLSTDLVCSFLIQLFESENPGPEEEVELDFDDYPEFNEFWDEQFGSFEMANASFAASEILFRLDPLAYRTAVDEFNSSANGPGQFANEPQ